MQGLLQCTGNRGLALTRFPASPLCAHGPPACALFRPAVYATLMREAEAAGKPKPPYSEGGCLYMRPRVCINVAKQISMASFSQELSSCMQCHC